MLLLSIFILIMAIALNYKHVLNSYLFIRIGFIIFALTGAISFNTLYLNSIGTGMGIYSGLFQVTTLTQFFDLFISIVGCLIFLSWPLSKNTSINTIEGISTISESNSLNMVSKKNYPREYTLVALLSTVGASLLISSSDLISLYLSIELQSFGVYILASIYRNLGSAVSAGLKYFLLGSLSSCIILLGASIIYTYTGITHFDSIYSFIFVTENQSILQGISLGIVLIFIGFFFKVGAAPLHNWSPDVYDDSPNIVTVWLTVMPKISIIIFLLELYLNIGIIEYNFSSAAVGRSFTLLDNNSIIYYLKNLILISSILSLIIGSTVGLSQNRIKRLLAYSTISHIGFILLALSINTEQSVESLIFYIVQYSLTNLNIFLIILAVGILIHSSTAKNYYSDNSFEDKGSENDVQYINELKGLFFYNPLLSLSLSICLFSMAGIPPLIGFFSKQFVLYAAIQKGFYFISIVAIIVSVISASYYLNVIKILHVSDSKNIVSSDSKEAGQWNINNTHSFIISTLTISILLFILKPSIILNSTAILSLTLFYY